MTTEATSYANTPFSLAGKVALVTGGSRGIGRAIALALAEAGAEVMVVSRTLAEGTQVAEQIEKLGRRSLAIAADVSRAADVEALTRQALDTFGRVDVLVNNAGISPAFTRTLKLAEADWREILDVNLTGTFLMCTAIGRHMVEVQQGSVINITSIGARVALPRMAAYCASKAGIEALTRVLAVEWAELGVRVNAIGPAFVATDLTEGLLQSAHFRAELLGQTPMRRFAEADELTGAAIYLASDASRYMTGQTIFVDGGWLAL